MNCVEETGLGELLDQGLVREVKRVDVPDTIKLHS